MKNFSYIVLLSTFILIGAGCQNQKPATSLPPTAPDIETKTVTENQKESESKSEPKTKPYTSNVSTVPIDKDFRITNVASWNPYDLGDPSAIFPIYAYNCDIAKIENGVAVRYSINFFAAKDEKNAPTILLGTTPGGSAGSGECDLHENESNLKSKLAPGNYRIWAVRYIDGKPDKRTPDVRISIVGS